METTKGKPFFVYDGECRFCSMWVDYSRKVTGDKVHYESFQKVAGEFPNIPLNEFKRSVKLITTKGEIYSGAHATFSTLAYNPQYKFLLWLYKHVPGFNFFSEIGYRFVASNRELAYWFTRLFIGKNLAPSSYKSLRWVFFRLLGLVYFLAILSFGVQMAGLIGSEGILPAQQFFDTVLERVGTGGYLLLPSLFWISASNVFLNLVFIVGLISSILLLIGVFERTNLVVLFIVYLSLVSAGQLFMSYQWDVFLLEIGFLAILFSFATNVIWLFRFLLFKFVILSGIGKFFSGGPTWQNFTALIYHYETQPLPMPLAWYAHQLPVWFHEIGVVFIFISQLIIPFFIFAPRRLRHFAGYVFVFLEVLILLTGNYNFFNLLTIALILLLFDDRAIRFIRYVLPRRVRNYIMGMKEKVLSVFGRFVIGVISFLLIFVGIAQIVEKYTGVMPPSGRAISRIVAPFHISNTYGLFTHMTTSRPEIIIEGSYDGEEWIAYEFKYKAGALDRPLPIVAPHQPRLDWQMWFAGLRGNYQNAPWIVNLATRLLEGSEPVLSLLVTNELTEKPPTFVRAILYDYKFTNRDERSVDGSIWKRERLGIYLPSVSLQIQ